MIDFGTIIGDCKFLTANEERELFRRWREEGDQEAYELLFKSIARFMLKVTWAFCSKHRQLHRLEDFQSHAAEGALRAIYKWDPNQETRLTTYAKYWILQCLQRAMCFERLIPIPTSRKHDKYLTAIKRAGYISTIDPKDYRFWESHEPLEDMVREEDHSRLRRGIRKLPRQERFILVARHFKDLTVRQIEACTGRSKYQLAKIERRALRSLKQYVEV